MALPEPSSKEGQANKGNDQDDKDFDPTPEALIDEIDDERTLEEEEALNGNNGKAVQEELDDLKKESEMPIEELLAYYERMRAEAQEGNNSDEEVEEEEDGEDEDYDEEGEVSRENEAEKSEEKAPFTSSSNIETDTANNATTLSATPIETTVSGEVKQLEHDYQQPSDVTDCAPTVATSLEKPKRSMTEFIIDEDGSGMFKSLLGYDLDDSDEMDEDYSYTDDENGEDERDWRRVIHVGPEFQAEVPEGLCKYDDLPPYENEDKLVWKCISDLTQEQILEYLKQASSLSKRENSQQSSARNLLLKVRPELSTEDYFEDEEQLLFLLTQCNYNLDEALRRRKLDPYKYFLHEPMSLWSQDECLGFESGLKAYGKNFRLIRENKVQTRTHAELVAFYYLWKKSERHDVYTNQHKLDRKRCLSHPGITDYMDKFIEDNESILNASSSSTPTPTDSTLGVAELPECTQCTRPHTPPSMYKYTHMK